jgi:DNA-binding winged helix-turn-helix (wHTH) protein
MSGQNQTVRFGPFELDIQIGELRKNNTRLKLQGQPIQILEMLLAKPGELVTRGEIQQRLWSSDTFVDSISA